MARVRPDRDILDRGGHMFSRAHPRPGGRDDSPPVPMCEPCAKRGPRKRRAGEPAVTYEPAPLAFPDLDSLCAAFLYRCFRCAAPERALSAYIVRCAW